ncbi:MAG: aconitase/3-isopropylmalate dehydratase large subunit family protein [Thermoplasmata archaeon]
MTILETLSMKAGKNIEPGEILEFSVDIALSHENTWLVIEKFRETGKKLFSNKKIFIVLDHRSPAESESTANLHARIRNFVRENLIEHFYDVGNGVCHEVLAESGLVSRGTLVIGTDSHTPTAGFGSAVGIGVGATDMAYVWATGRIYLKVPEVKIVEFRGSAQQNVMAYDVGLWTLSKLGMGYEYTAFELAGEYIFKLHSSGKKTLCNLLVETGAKTIAVSDCQNHEIKPYSIIEVSELAPAVALPGNPADVKNAGDLNGVEVDQIFVGTCTSGRLEDIAMLASVLKNRKVRKDVRMIVSPATKNVLSRSVELGYIKILLDAGCTILPPGCGPCLGAHMGVLGDDEACLSAGNRNYHGRMGSKHAKIYLASPYTCARAGISGMIEG